MSESNVSIKLEADRTMISRVIEYSSHYNNSALSANQIIGPPKVYSRHGNRDGAWTQRFRGNNEFITVEFERAVYREHNDIYETYSPGAIVKILIRNDNSEWKTIWETELPHHERQSRIFSIPCTNASEIEIDQIRLNINCRAARNRCEIDCIKLIGHSSYIDFSSKEILTNLKDLLTDDCLVDVTFQLDKRELILS